MLRNGLEPWHLIVVAIVVIVLFGSKKLPEAARGLGKSMRILKSEAKAMKSDDTPAPGGAPTSSTVPAPEAITPSDVVTANEATTPQPTAATTAK
ncbi:sec-independent protein translocase protein TatA [Streptomyces sp. DvalAA-14]|uniref:Sec-independent protein translocase subunit TatA n=1 Tax=unclassified Streptomyces TaxID=2593676 RepID=UPI00081B5E3B|nr:MULTISPECIES: Sec-independent protein translocase subunit TatA [unclassified Streptomyces]MYS20190.1 twin-arginine translocase TatA/TatE family subunit [Streptomyces sp. SID4948]SCD62974.1 sec-independent protein translocase protein TatA [Streptomyces sp. DvalAA-14]